MIAGSGGAPAQNATRGRTARRQPAAPPDTLATTLAIMSQLTHFDTAGQAHMVDVGAKDSTHRVAIATGTIKMAPATFALVRDGNAKKGDVLGIARVAGIMATKRTADLIPLCHPIGLTKVALDYELDEASHSIHCTVRTETRGQTGVEMEALTGVQVALLTIYDMCKAVDRGMVMTNVRLLEKHGGKSGDWTAGTGGAA